MLNWLRDVGSSIHRLVLDSGALVEAAYLGPGNALPPPAGSGLTRWGQCIESESHRVFAPSEDQVSQSSIQMKTQSPSAEIQRHSNCPREHG